MLRELMSYDTLRINGVKYKNLPALDWMFDHDRLRNLFAKDPVGTIHGDLTIENIICRTDNDSWYLIDPNTGNLHESPFLDYGKLLQSLHGSYEFMMKTPRVAVQDNRIDFQLTRSAAYDALLAAVMEDLSARYPREQVESILMHEVIHWLRLMPYKLEQGPQARGNVLRRAGHGRQRCGGFFGDIKRRHYADLRGSGRDPAGHSAGQRGILPRGAGGAGLYRDR